MLFCNLYIRSQVCLNSHHSESMAISNALKEVSSYKIQTFFLLHSSQARDTFVRAFLVAGSEVSAPLGASCNETC